MSSSPQTSFEGDTVQAFSEYEASLRGHVRYEVTRRNLVPFLGKNLLVADVGGGSGPDALWFANQGHSVVLIEPSEDQIRLAETRIGAGTPETASRISVFRGAAKNALESGQDYVGNFDLVLSHGVIMYLDDPAERIRELADLAKSGGHLSLLEKGYEGARARLIQEGEFGEVARLEEGVVNKVNQKRWPFRPEELEGMLRSAGIQVLQWSGVRVITDTMHDVRASDISPQDLTTILDTEWEQGNNPSIRGIGQMLHFIGRKN